MLATAVATAACDDGFRVGRLPTIENSFTLYSAARPEHMRLPSAIDFLRLSLRSIEHQYATADGWDVALTEVDGAFWLAPAATFPGFEDLRAGIVPVTGASFESVERAPAASDEYVEKELVALEPGRIYIVRSRRRDGCTVYAKIRPAEIDEAHGRVEFDYLLNPNCGDRSLVPDDGDD